MAENKHDSRKEQDVHVPDLVNPQTRHEEADVDAWAVGKFAIGLIFLCILSLGLVLGLFKYLASREGGPRPSEELNVDASKLPPNPRLQDAPILDLKRMRDAEDQILNGYGWVDQQAGSVHIPIDRAIDILAQRGLPARTGGEVQSSANGITVPTESSLGRKVQQPGGPLAGGEVK